MSIYRRLDDELIDQDGKTHLRIKLEVGDTLVESNGSKWNGQLPDMPDKLLEVLAAHKLNDWAHYEVHASGRVRVFGNFEDVSHVFNIETRDPILADLLLAGLRAQGLK